MKSNRLSFNRAVALDVLRRCWPFWVCYLGFLTLMLPLTVVHDADKLARAENLLVFGVNVREEILSLAVTQAQAGIVTGLLAVMILFGYLYNNRGNTLMNALPVRRESLFFTLYLTGLIPMLLCQLLVMGVTMLLTLGSGIEEGYFLQWFVCAALGLIAFYGFAVFCAMLTGNVIILPAVYFVLNLAAVVYESCTEACLAQIVYGMSYNARRFSFLSPIVKLNDALTVVTQYPDRVTLNGLGVLAAYAAAGVVFAVFAMLLYRKRRMESVSDFVAIPILKPIFRYCMGFGAALVFAGVVYDNYFQSTVYGSKAAWLMAALLVIGAFLGWLIAEMMIQRTVRAFPLPWKGLALVCAVCVLVVFAAETDLTGYEKRVPDPSRVERVTFSYDSAFSDPENILAVTELHREVIQDKALYDGTDQTFIAYGEQMYYLDANTDRLLDPNQPVSFWMPLQYTMKDGSTLQRSYNIEFRAADLDDPDSTIGRALALLNGPEGIRGRMMTDLPMEEEYVNYAVIYRENADWSSTEYRLTPQETLELWNTAMIPDAEDGRLSLYTIADTDENIKTQTNLRIQIALFDETRQQTPYYWSHAYRVFTFSDRSLKWIEDHTDLDWSTLTELYRLRAQD